MQPPRQRCAGQRDVEELVKVGQSGTFELPLTRSERLFETLSHSVQRDAVSRSRTFREPHLSSLPGQPGGVSLPSSPEVVVPRNSSRRCRSIRVPVTGRI